MRRDDDNSISLRKSASADAHWNRKAEDSSGRIPTTGGVFHLPIVQMDDKKLQLEVSYVQ